MNSNRASQCHNEENRALESLGFQIISQFKNALLPLILRSGIFQLSKFLFVYANRFSSFCKRVDEVKIKTVLTVWRFQMLQPDGRDDTDVLKFGEPVFFQCPLHAQLF